jgi:hypothetical protein
VNLEPYAPAVSLLLLGILGLISFTRVRALISRFGDNTMQHSAAPVTKTSPAPAAPWWESHLDDYVGKLAPVIEEECSAEPEPCVHEYVMQAPVEMWFGDVLVAVRSGSDTDRRFQRFADVLFEELRSSRPAL